MRHYGFGRGGNTGAILGSIPVAEPKVTSTGLAFAIIQWAFLSMGKWQMVHLFCPESQRYL
ncbi:hypothetical protein ASA01S_032_00040 [Aeromonas salmonicida subsp. masoucida NBRC 13784]|nr:hypothetical protein ASA01S_032_00040 [Aeromonas salmonicida subsp. masoucida NBRC 13784]